MASKSSWDSKRSRHAKNFVDAKKFGKSEELQPHQGILETFVSIKDSRIQELAKFVSACSIVRSKSEAQIKHRDMNQYLLPSAALSSSAALATAVLSVLLVRAPARDFCWELEMGSFQVASVTSGSLPVSRKRQKVNSLM